ncbi:hypothetical protein SEUCBS139899_001749 [Sporothrix eucalyptigena]
MGAVAATSWDQPRASIDADPYRTLSWTTSKRTVICASFVGSKQLNLDQPTSIHHSQQFLERAAKVIGLVTKLT